MKFFIFGLGLLLSALSLRAQAVELSSDTQVGSYLIQETLGASGDFESAQLSHGKKPAEPLPSFNWNAVYDIIKTTSAGDGISGGGVTDTTNQITLDLGYDNKNTFDVSFGIQYANTPQEALKYFGPELSLKYNFSSVISAKVEFTDLTYTQTFTTNTVTKRGLPRPSNSDNVIKQVASEFELDVNPTDNFSVKVSYSYYFYDRDVNSFLQFLDSPRSVAMGASAFSGTVGGFPAWQESLGLVWTPGKLWEFDGDIVGSPAASDGSWTWSYKGGFLYELFADFRAGLSLEYEYAPTLTDHIYGISLKYSL